jgi:succinate dehydrogenase / fumarate reductase, cytochrome b subunit
MTRSSVRPLSPHLTIWRMNIHMFVSIFNRAMGVGLATLGVVGLVWWLTAAASGKEAYALFIDWADSWIGYVVAVGLTFAFFFHLVMGLRHFVMDVGAGFELKGNRNWAWMMLIIAGLLTAAVWLYVIFGRI